MENANIKKTLRYWSSNHGILWRQLSTNGTPYRRILHKKIQKKPIFLNSRRRYICIKNDCFSLDLLQ